MQPGCRHRATRRWCWRRRRRPPRLNLLATMSLSVRELAARAQYAASMAPSVDIVGENARLLARGRGTRRRRGGHRALGDERACGASSRKTTTVSSSSRRARRASRGADAGRVVRPEPDARRRRRGGSVEKPRRRSRRRRAPRTRFDPRSFPPLCRVPRWVVASRVEPIDRRRGATGPGRGRNVRAPRVPAPRGARAQEDVVADAAGGLVPPRALARSSPRRSRRG